jgi:hypothetical protein
MRILPSTGDLPVSTARIHLLPERLPGKQRFWMLRRLAYPRTGPPSAYATISSANCELFVGEVERREADIGKRSRPSVALASVDP